MERLFPSTQSILAAADAAKAGRNLSLARADLAQLEPSVRQAAERPQTMGLGKRLAELVLPQPMAQAKTVGGGNRLMALDLLMMAEGFQRPGSTVRPAEVYYGEATNQRFETFEPTRETARNLRCEDQALTVANASLLTAECRNVLVLEQLALEACDATSCAGS
jgi:hypothetical protein